MTDANFEFDSGQNEVVSDLSKKMQFVGTLLLVAGVLNLLGGLVAMFSDAASGVSTLVSGVVYLAIGLWTRKAADSFKEIVDTEGSDVDHLMGALGQLLKLYRLQYWLIMIILVVAVLVFVVGMFAGIAAG